MSTITYDSLNAAKILEASGIPPAQAQAILQTQREALDCVVAAVASKADIGGLKAELQLLRSDMKAESLALRSEMREGLAALRSEMREELAALRSEMREELAALRSEMREELAALRGELKETAAALRGEMKAESAALRGEMTSIKWMMGVLVTLAIANFAKQFF